MTAQRKLLCQVCMIAILGTFGTFGRAQVLFSEDFEGYADGSNLFGQGGWGDHPFYGGPPNNFPEETLVAQGIGLSTRVSNGRIDTGSGTFGYVVQPIAAPASSDVYTLSFDAYGNSTAPNAHVGHFGFVFDDGSVIVWQAGNNPQANPPLIDVWRFTVDPVTGNHADNTFYVGGFDRLVHFEIVIDAENMAFFGRYDFGAGFLNTPTFSLTQVQVDQLNGLLILNDYRRPADYLGIEVDNIVLTKQVADPLEAIQQVVEELQDIISADPSSPLADKLEDAAGSAAIALMELNKTPPDNQAAAGAIEGAVGDLEAAINEGFDPSEAATLMDVLAGAVRQIAQTVLDEAIASGGDPVEILEVQQSLISGDALREVGAFKDSVASYKDAISKAESAMN